jgi:hypothetical protein
MAESAFVKAGWVVDSKAAAALRLPVSETAETISKARKSNMT